MNIEKLIDDNKNLVYSIANTFYRKNTVFSLDDLIQVGFLALCKNGYKYDPKRGKISTFITCCVKNDIIKFIKSNTKIPSYSGLFECTEASYNDQIPENIYDILRPKNNLEIDIIKLKKEGFSNKAVSLKLNISNSKLSKILIIIYLIH